jgi:hypothetical protein
LGATCDGVCFGEEFGEADDSCFGAEEIGWDYVFLSVWT